MPALKTLLNPAAYGRKALAWVAEGEARRARARLIAGGRPGGTRRAAIIPPAVPGSLGDAAMISASAGHLLDNGRTAVDLLFGDAWPLDADIAERIDSSDFFYRGSAPQHAALLRRLSAYDELYFIGADVIDGAYAPGSVRRRLSLIADFAAAGGRARILGCSYNAQPEETTRRALARLPRDVTICARDPVSRARLEEALGRPPRQVADLAFLLKPRPQHPDAARAIAWIAARRAEGDGVIALNANYLQAAKEPGIREALRRLIELLVDARISIVLVPHDSRSDESDAVLLGNALKGLEPGQRARTHMLETLSPGAVKATLAAVDFLVTGRLHAQILAMGSGTPVFSLVYQGKFEGLLQLFDLDPAPLLSTPAAFAGDPAMIATRVRALLADAPAWRRQILARLPYVTGLSQANFAE